MIVRCQCVVAVLAALLVLRARATAVGVVCEVPSGTALGATHRSTSTQSDPDLDAFTERTAAVSTLPAVAPVSTLIPSSALAMSNPRSSESPSSPSSMHVHVSLVSYADFYAQFEQMSHHTAARGRVAAPEVAQTPVPNTNCNIGDCVLSIHAPSSSAHSPPSD